MTDDNPAHVLVDEAFDLMNAKLEQDEITRADIEECKAALVEAIEHPESDIWVTITCEGPKNQLEHQRYPDGRYQWDPGTSNRECLERITAHKTRVTVDA